MMCAMSIRRLTAAERAARDEAEGMHYDTLFAEIEGAERAEYDEEFGPVFRQQHPYKPDGNVIHRKVMARLDQERNEQF